jgi:hypothetical protein
VTPEQQGAAVLVTAGAGVGLAVFVYSRDAFVLLVWALGAVAVWWAAKRPNKSVRDAPDPAPPGTSERGSEQEPQVSMVRDTTHPNRWIVARDSPWLTVEIDKEDRDET